jgi:hypothetical protein
VIHQYLSFGEGLSALELVKVDFKELILSLDISFNLLLANG